MAEPTRLELSELLWKEAGYGHHPDKLCLAFEKCAAALRSADEEIARLTNWVNDLQSGMYINCVYCGHRYGPEDEVPTSMADVLKEHIAQCPQHPLSAERKRAEHAEAEIERLIKERDTAREEREAIAGYVLEMEDRPTMAQLKKAEAALAAKDKEIERLKEEVAGWQRDANLNAQTTAREHQHAEQAEAALAEMRLMAHDIVSGALGLKDRPDHGATVYLSQADIGKLMAACNYVPALNATEGE